MDPKKQFPYFFLLAGTSVLRCSNRRNGCFFCNAVYDRNCCCCLAFCSEQIWRFLFRSKFDRPQPDALAMEVLHQIKVVAAISPRAMPG